MHPEFAATVKVVSEAAVIAEIPPKANSRALSFSYSC
jgi:hypothetical protein